MSYMEEYKKRIGDCQYCEREHSVACNECYGYSFKDKLSFFDFIRKSVKEQAAKRFDDSKQGHELLDTIVRTECVFKDAKQRYNDEKEKFVEEALQKLESQIEQLGSECFTGENE